ncbi:MAG: DUF3108 domain-containing protein [Candidatus Omnitrophica bacterium]|nr:DUF3108 domain-containing protein [Candidatus Omnitrophota bacterium]
MNKKTIILLILIMNIFNFFSDSHRSVFPNTIINPSKKELKIGESLIYRLELFGFPIGWINLNVREKINFKGNSVYHLIAQAYTNRFFKKIYDVEYNLDTYIDTQTFLPYRFRKQRKLKGKLTEIQIDFDWIERKAFIVSNGLINIVNLEEKMQDLLSSIYYFRMMDIETKNDYNLKIFYGNQSWQINIKVDSIENMEIYRQGNFEVFKIKIETDLTQIILGTPRINVYFFNNTSRVPLVFFLRIPFGHLKGKIYNPLN